MDCISVYAAGFHNVIASSGTAFTELQAKLLGRFSKNVVVNFDPDTAGAKATERTLGLLVEEEFQIKVLTLEQGFDPDLYIRRKGKDAYGAALRHFAKIFRLPDRARPRPIPGPHRRRQSQGGELSFAPRAARPQPHRARRTGAGNRAKAGIDSAVLRQELKHVAATRSAASRQGSGRSPGHRRRTHPDPRPGLSPPNAARRRTRLRPRRRRGRIRSRPPGPLRPGKRSLCTAALPPNRSPRPCSMPGPELPM